MKLYGGIDLHSNNCVVCLLDEQDKVVYQRRLANDLALVFSALEPYGASLEGLVVESTYNWYWLVDGLMEAGYRVHLANTAAIQQYEGLKHSNDHHDARWLAHLLRLSILPEGFIYPKEERAVRDLLRKRAQLVRQRTLNVLSIQNLLARNLGTSMSANRIKRLSDEGVDELLPEATLGLAVKSNLAVLKCLEQQTSLLEAAVLSQTKNAPGIPIVAQCAGDWPDSGADHHAGDGDDFSVSAGRRLRLVLPVRGQPAVEQREEEGAR
jgi:transposase